MGKQRKYRREVLLKNSFFSKYQPDFLRVVLHKPYYTLAEAKKAVKEFFEKE